MEKAIYRYGFEVRQKVLAFCLCMFALAINAQYDQWTQLGMVKFPENPSVQTTGMGRVSHLVFHPTDTNILFAVSASGGVWRSINEGKTWKPLTDGLPQTSCASLCVNHKNAATLYLGTGDANYYSSGMGVWKSTDNGKTWTQTNTGMGNVLVVQIVMHPTDTNILVATTSGGIYKTINGGTSWVKKSSISDSYNDLVKRPGSKTALYATSFNSFYYSTNFGETWTQLKISPSDTFSGMYLGVTKADSNVIYCATWRSKSWGSKTYFGGVYKSSNGGLNWKKQSSNNPQILGYSSDGSSNDGQGAYNLTITADPKDAATVYVGAINIWKSKDSAVTWKLKSHWVTGVHADKHHFIFSPHNDKKLYITHDGGIDRSVDTGANWKTISDGLTASEFYKMGQSSLNREKALGGLQDNGLNYYKNGIFYTIRGGDYTEDFLFDYLDSNYQYFQGSTNQYNLNTFGSRSLATVNPGIYELNWQDTNIAYNAKINLYRTKNLRATSVVWTQLSDSLIYGGNSQTTALASTKSNPNFIYWAKNNGALYRVDYVNSTTPVFVSLTKPSGNISNMATYAKDSSVIYISITNKIYKSTNKGLTWWNMTKNLPTVGSIISIKVDNYATDSSIYVATSSGVYYKNKTLTNWVSLSSNLPAIARISDMDMFNDGTSKSCIRVSTYGRGIWQTALYQYLKRKPVCDFSIQSSSLNCARNYIFNDLSTGGQYTRNWSIFPTTGFQYTNGSDSTDRQPEIEFTKQGIYAVTLIIKNNYGTSELTRTVAISDLSVPATCSINTTNLGSYTIGIQRFELAGLDKSSNYSLYKNPNLEDYSCQSSIFVKPGKAYTAWITNGNSYNENGKIYIDYNNDGDFLDANESVASFTSGLGRRSTTVTILSNPPVVNNYIRLRVVSDYNTVGAACGTLSYGQAEDYALYIDNTRPSIVWEMPKPKVYGKFKAKLKLSEYCATFDTSFIKLTNAKIIGMNKTNSVSYEFDIVPLNTGKIYAKIAAGAFTDLAGNNNLGISDSTLFELGLNTYTFTGHSVRDSIFQNDTGGMVKSYVYYGTDVTSLVATFTVSDSIQTWVLAQSQTSGTTANNFTNSVLYTLKTADGSFTKRYSVQVIVLPDTSCNLLSFEFKNPNATGQINWSNNPGQVNISVPFGTAITNRAAWTSISANARLYAQNQTEISGTTLHDFTKNITYKVVAQDTHYFKTYNIVVHIAKNTACDLLQWDILTPAVSGTITPKDTTGGYVSATLPFGVSRSSLTAVFKVSDSAKLLISGIKQISGTTTQNYSDTVVAIVKSQDGLHTKLYKIKVKNALSDACDLLTYKFNSPLAAGTLTPDTTGGKVQVYVPENTDLTNLIAAFTLSDSATAKIATQEQKSGITANNFTNTVTYTVVSQSGLKTKKYLVTVTKLLGLYDPSLDLFNVYPNPAQNELTINIPSDPKEFEVVLYDNIGKQIYSAKNLYHLDLTQWAPGIYELQIKTGLATQSKRIVKE